MKSESGLKSRNYDVQDHDSEELKQLLKTIRGDLDSERQDPELLRLMKPRWLKPSASNDGRQAQWRDASESQADHGVSDPGREPARSASEVVERIAVEISERIQLSSEQLKNVRAREGLSGRHESMWLRARIDECLRWTSEEINAVARSHEETVRDALLPHGKFYEMARTVTDRIETSHLLIEDLSDTSMVQLIDSTTFEIQQRVIRELIAYLEVEAQRVNREVAKIVKQVSFRVAALVGFDVEFERPVFESCRVQDFAATTALAPIVYQNEFPRVSGGAFAWQAFIQPAMLAGMLLMPFWILMMDFKSKDIIDKSVNRSGLLLILFAILYPGYLFYQRQKVPKDRKNRIRRELLKAKSTIKAEVERTFRSVLDEQKRALSEHWRKVSDEIRQQVMDCLGLSAETRIASEYFEDRLKHLKSAEEQVAEIRKDLAANPMAKN